MMTRATFKPNVHQKMTRHSSNEDLKKKKIKTFLVVNKNDQPYIGCHHSDKHRSNYTSNRARSIN